MQKLNYLRSRSQQIFSLARTRPARNFSSYNRSSDGAGAVNWGLLGVGTAGLGYMIYKARESRTAATYATPDRMPMSHSFDEAVRNRVNNTICYFGSGLAITGLMTGMLRATALANMNPFLLFIGSMGLMLGTQFTSYENTV